MIQRMMAAVAALMTPPEAKPKVARSGRWPKVRAEHLKREPECQACGTRERLEVHHIVPFGVDRSRELDPTNLITLCETPSRNCHCSWGHLYSFATSWNPTVCADVAVFREKVRNRPLVPKGGPLAPPPVQ